jgi:acyl phosphate:glycerol-3-phosphate acyltransferase
MIWGAVAVVLGHNWSIFATLLTGRIRGGKGAATASGTWVLLVPPLFIALVLMMWALIVYVTRYVSLGVLSAMGIVTGAIVVMVLINDREPVYIFYVLVAVMVFLRHHANIKAILNGTERRWDDRPQPK